MPEQVVTKIEQVTAPWLTSVLANSGALTRGAVSAFEAGSGRGAWSTNATLRLSYTAEAQGSLPHRLFLKMVNTDLGGQDDFDDSEVTYYTRDYVNLAQAPILRCYHASYSPELKRYHLLLEDVTGTHIEAAEKAPTLEAGLALAEGLAVLHAHWWGAQGLAEAGTWLPHADRIQNFVDLSALGLAPLQERFSAEVGPRWQGLLREQFANHPQLMFQRTGNPHGFTLIHGDVGSKNVLVPRSGERPLYLIDRQPFKWALTTWLGVYDLAYALVLDWEIDTRRQSEIPILRRYHETLLQKGVLGYSWEQLVEDYRLSVPICVYVATEYFRHGAHGPWVHVWLEMLQRALTACEDLECSLLWS